MEDRPDQTKIVPEVGMPCTVQVGSDFYAGVVKEILSPKKLIVTREHHDDMVTIKRKNGRWTETGRKPVRLVTFGEAYHHMDPSF